MSGTKIPYPPELYDQAICRQHIGWLKVFLAQMTEESWRDMKDRCERQLAELSIALQTKDQPK